MTAINSPAADGAHPSTSPTEARAPQFDTSLPMPNLFIVGAAKAGTTSLHAYLAQHPEVFMSERKEPHFFASFEMHGQFDNFMPPVRNPAEYQELFSGSEGRRVIGEASPSYLSEPDSPGRIKSAAPDAKIIISLRNPVQRAYSAYLMEFHAGQETLPFKDALIADEKREQRWGRAFQYVELGMYTNQVARYFDTFGRENVLVILFEDLIRDTASAMRNVADFLEIDPNQFAPSRFQDVHNPFAQSRGPLARSLLRMRPLRLWAKRWAPQVFRDAANRLIFTNAKKPKMDDEIRRSLAARFAPDLQRLEQLLACDLGALREAP